MCTKCAFLTARWMVARHIRGQRTNADWVDGCDNYRPDADAVNLPIPHSKKGNRGMDPMPRAL